MVISERDSLFVVDNIKEIDNKKNSVNPTLHRRAEKLKKPLILINKNLGGMIAGIISNCDINGSITVDSTGPGSNIKRSRGGR
jgi:hypothetical protein